MAGEPTRCVVFLSGGLMSWCAGKRAAGKFGPKNTTLFFTDTLIEDADAYRFLILGAENILGRRLPFEVPAIDDFPPTFIRPAPGQPRQINPAWLDFLAELRERTTEAMPELVWIADGRDPWTIFTDEKHIGNTRTDPCSKLLKREIGVKWLAVAGGDPAITDLVFGIHWEEAHRLEGERWDKNLKAKVPSGVRVRYRALGWPHVSAPMCEAPWMSELDVRAAVRDAGLFIPRLYKLGFSHNNCGGFCVKAGEGHFANLLRQLPEVYAAHEDQEEAFNALRPGKRRQTVLAPERPQPDGKRKRVPMSLREFREALARGETFDMFNTGGCGCFLEEAEGA